MRRWRADGLLVGLVVVLWGCATAAPAVPTRAPTVSSEPSKSIPAGLRARLEGIGRRLEPLGVSKGEVTLAGFLSSGGRQSFPIELPAKRCATIVSLATRGIVDMDAALYTPDGQMLAADSQPDSHPALQLCGGAEPARYYLVLRSYDGSGSFVVTTFEGPRSLLPQVAQVLGGRPALAHPPDSRSPVQDALQTFSTGLERRGYKPLGEPLELSLATTQTLRWPVRVERGQCYAIAAFGHDGLRDVRLRVVDDRGQPVVGDRSPLSEARVQFCAPGEAEFAVEAHAQAGQGQATLVVLRGPSHRVLGLSGLWVGQSEGSRLAPAPPVPELLAKLEAEAAEAGFGKPQLREQGHLQPGEVQEHELLLRGQRCYRLVAVAGPGLQSLSLAIAGTGGEAPETPPMRPMQMAGASAGGGRGQLDTCRAATELVRVRVLAAAGTGDYVLTVLER